MWRRWLPGNSNPTNDRENVRLRQSDVNVVQADSLHAVSDLLLWAAEAGLLSSDDHRRLAAPTSSARVEEDQFAECKHLHGPSKGRSYLGR